MRRLYIVFIPLAVIIVLLSIIYFYLRIDIKPVVPLQRKQLIVGAYYHTFDSEQSPFWQNYLRRKLTLPQKPQLDEYTCRNLEIIKQHLKWAKESNIKFFAINWFGPASTSDITVKNYIVSYLSRNQEDFHFCLVYQTPYILPFEKGVIVINREALQLLQNHFLYIASEYFNEPNYLKINNRPVLFLANSHLFRGEIDLAITKTSNIVQQRTGFNIFLVGDEILLPEEGVKATEPDKKRIALFDAITTSNIFGPTRYDGFPLLTGFFRDVDSTFNKFSRIAGELNIGFIPNAMPGFNNRGFIQTRTTISPPILPREITDDKENEGTTYQVFLHLAKKHLDPKLNILMITSFNNWMQDTQIEPLTSDFITPCSSPAEFTDNYPYYPYHDLYLRLTKKTP
jgi:hypothetical protein